MEQSPEPEDSVGTDWDQNQEEQRLRWSRGRHVCRKGLGLELD